MAKAKKPKKPNKGRSASVIAADRRRQFIVNYLQHFNATRAYIDAGYGDGPAAGTCASRLLNSAEVRPQIEEALRKGGITKERLVERLAGMMEADLGDFADVLTGRAGLRELKERGVNTRLLKSMTVTTTEAGGSVRVEMHDQQAAVMNIAKLLGLVVDRHEVHGTLTGDLSGLSDDELARMAAVGVADRPTGEGSTPTQARER